MNQKIKLTQVGFEGYTGQMGVTFFENGISTKPMLQRDAVRMAAVMSCEWEDGSSPNVAQHILDNMDTPAPMLEVVSSDESEVALVEQVASDLEATEVTYDGICHTEEGLFAIADRDGIKGLREIAELMNIKGNSIKDLVAEILKVTAKA